MFQHYLKASIILLIFFLASCEGTNKNHQSSDTGYSELMDNRRFMTVEEVAEAIINQDPSIYLIDVRSEDEFNAYALPGAAHIALEKMADKKILDDLDCEKYKMVFYANDQVLSDQAWYISRENGCQNAYVVQGGLNSWFKNILMPTPPQVNEPAEIQNLYNLRMGMRNFFLGFSKELVKEEIPVPKVKKTVVPKPKEVVEEEEEEEGC